MTGSGFAFGPFELDTVSRTLRHDGEPVALGSRHYELLRALLARAGEIVSKDELIAAGWADVAVSDNSLEQGISALRRLLARPTGETYIETHARRGYRFAAAVRPVAPRQTEEALDVLLAPHRSWIEGRAALETLERSQILHAREVFLEVLRSIPDQASAHVGLANAYALECEMTRLDAAPNADAAGRAASHAREACRLEPGYGEAWATLGFVLDRTGHRGDALAALRRAVSLEPDNWRHHLRLAYASWGEERLRAARRTLALLPGFPLAHWLAATVHVARQSLGEARRDLDAGCASQTLDGESGRFRAVALHWLLGLVLLAEGEPDRAVEAFHRELQAEPRDHLYARECCANVWYAIGAVHHAAGQRDLAAGALRAALTRIPAHLPARAALSAYEPQGASPGDPAESRPGELSPARSFEGELAGAVRLVVDGASGEAARRIDRALAAAPPGNAGWLLPVEPWLQVWTCAERWASALGRLRARSA